MFLDANKRGGGGEITHKRDGSFFKFPCTKMRREQWIHGIRRY